MHFVCRHSIPPIPVTVFRVGPRLRRHAGGYADATQTKHLRRVLGQHRTTLGLLTRDIQRKATPEQQQKLATLLARAERIRSQQSKTRTMIRDKQLHAVQSAVL